MSNTQEPAPEWGGKTEWSQPQGSPSPPPPSPPSSGPAPYASAPGGYQVPPAGPYGQPLWQGARPTINSYLIPAILVTLFCFLPTGIAAIVFASQVSSKISVGDYAGATEASKKARLWTIVSLVVGAVFILLLIVVTVAASNNNSNTGG